MRFTAARRSRAPVINLTSLIDVLFLLIIFLLLSAKFETEGGIAVDLPQGQSAEVPRDSTYVLTIVHDGTMFLQKERVRDDNALREAIAATRQKLKDPTLVIEADKSVPWERIVVVTDTAKLAGQGKVNFRIKP